MIDRYPTTRRDFLKSAATTGLAIGALPTATLFAQEDPTPTPAKNPVRIAFIGTGGMGHTHVEEIWNAGHPCPCYCDVDVERQGQAKKRFPKAKAYQDYRRMLDKHHNEIDAVIIATPDHHHYPATMMAMQLGKHVYTQKPLTHTPWEARQLMHAAQRYKVATQMGNQGHASHGWRLVYEWVRSGLLGDIREVHSWTDRPVWPQGVALPEEPAEVPAQLDWDVWLGPAKMRPYHKGTYHPFRWRAWWDFGAGALGDMACHIMDGLFWSLAPGHATAIECMTRTPWIGDCYPTASVVRWEFPAADWRPGFVAYWYDGDLRPTLPPELALDRDLPTAGNLFVGTKATLMVSGSYGDSPRIIPESKMREIGKPPKMLERSPGHMTEWLLACQGEKPLDYPGSNFAYAGPMTEAILLGNIAVRMGRRLEWDGEKMEFTNVPEANEFVTKEYRDGWRV